MILDNNEALARLESPHNLLNRIRNISGDIGPVLPDRVEKNSPVIGIAPTADELIDDLDDKLIDAKTVSGANAVLSECINALRGKMDRISKPEKISKIAVDMSRIIQNSKEEKGDKNQTVIIFKPLIASESSFEVVHVHESD